MAEEVNPYAHVAGQALLLILADERDEARAEDVMAEMAVEIGRVANRYGFSVESCGELDLEGMLGELASQGLVDIVDDDGVKLTKCARPGCLEPVPEGSGFCAECRAKL